MKCTGLVLFACLIFKLSIYAQTTKSKHDSIFQAWRSNKEYNYKLVHISIGGGLFTPLEGNMVNTMQIIYPQGAEGSFGYTAVKEVDNESTSIFLGFNIKRRLIIGAALLPQQHHCFEGGKGVNLEKCNFFFCSNEFLQGIKAEEHVYSNSYALNCSYVIMPYKRLKKAGMEITGGGGIFLNNVKVTTDLFVYDYTTDANGVKTLYSTAAKYNEVKNGLGVYLNLRADLFLGRSFSIYGQATCAAGEKIEISQKSLSFMTQTAFVPSHYVSVRGVGATAGLAFHIGNIKYKPKTPNAGINQ